MSAKQNLKHSAIAIIIFTIIVLAAIFLSGCSSSNPHVLDNPTPVDTSSSSSSSSTSTLPDTITYLVQTSGTIKDCSYFVNGDKYTMCGSDTFRFRFVAHNPQQLKVTAMFHRSASGECIIKINDEVERKSIQPSNVTDPYFRAQAEYNGYKAYSK